MATTTLVSCGRPSTSRLLSIRCFCHHGDMAFGSRPDPPLLPLLYVRPTPAQCRPPSIWPAKPPRSPAEAASMIHRREHRLPPALTIRRHFRQFSAIPPQWPIGPIDSISSSPLSQILNRGGYIAPVSPVLFVS